MNILLFIAACCCLFQATQQVVFVPVHHNPQDVMLWFAASVFLVIFGCVLTPDPLDS